jgi:hypothetical protein
MPGADMKRLLKLGFLVGLLGTLLAAYFVPWVGYARFPSAARVIANGGRGEQFTIRLPMDRIHAADSAGQWASPYSRGLNLLATEGAAPSRIEHFRLRDIDGNILGLAVRHTTSSETSSMGSWLLVIPSRGSVTFTGGVDAVPALESALAEFDWQPGTEIDELFEFELGLTGLSVAATGEFEGIDFQLIETWALSSVDADGELRGTISLNTIGQRRP